MIHPMKHTIFSLFTWDEHLEKKALMAYKEDTFASNFLSAGSYLLTSSLEPHEDWSHTGLSIHQPHLLPELCVLEHALLVQLNTLLQNA